MWQGDFTTKPPSDVRDKLLSQRAEIIAQIETLKITPLPKGGDQQQLKRFRDKDLLELATKIVRIDNKLGRNQGAKMNRV